MDKQGLILETGEKDLRIMVFGWGMVAVLVILGIVALQLVQFLGVSMLILAGCGGGSMLIVSLGKFLEYRARGQARIAMAKAMMIAARNGGVPYGTIDMLDR